MARKPKGEAAAKSRSNKPGRKPGTPDYPLEKREEFRAHYLLSGVVAQSARAVAVPETTAHGWAKELCKEPAFAEDRRDLRVRYLDELVAMRMRVAVTSLERFEDDLPMPELVGEGAQVTIIDKRPDYGDLVLAAEKNAHNLVKLEKPEDPDAPGAGGNTVTISIRGPATVAAGG